jgi:hypothetical protein
MHCCAASAAPHGAVDCQSYAALAFGAGHLGTVMILTGAAAADIHPILLVDLPVEWADRPGRRPLYEKRRAGSRGGALLDGYRLSCCLGFVRLRLGFYKQKSTPGKKRSCHLILHILSVERRAQAAPYSVKH